jgi:hypothetical protein
MAPKYTAAPKVTLQGPYDLAVANEVLQKDNVSDFYVIT